MQARCSGQWLSVQSGTQQMRRPHRARMAPERWAGSSTGGGVRVGQMRVAKTSVRRRRRKGGGAYLQARERGKHYAGVSAHGQARLLFSQESCHPARFVVRLC